MSETKKWAQTPQGKADVYELCLSPAFKRFHAALAADVRSTTRQAIAPGAVPNGREFMSGYTSALTDLLQNITPGD